MMPSGFGNATRTSTVRVAASTTGCTNVTSPVNVRPGRVPDSKRAGGTDLVGAPLMLAQPKLRE